MNILIPAAGLGKRFLEDGYSRPKPLIHVLGEPMIFYVIRNLRVTRGDQIHIIYTQDLERYSFQAVLRKEFPDLALHFLRLNTHTRGPAETVLCGLNNLADLNEKVLVLDCDTFYREDIVAMARAEQEHCIFYFQDESRESLFSYIQIDAANQVTEIREKTRISNHACTGAYGFKSGHLLKTYCEQVLNGEIKSNNEYYLSNVYAQLLQDGERVVPYLVESLHCLGTPEQLKIYCLNHRSDPKRFCFDLDGTLVTFPRERANYKTVEPILPNIRLVRYLHKHGHTIIIQTARKMLTSHHNAGEAARRAYQDVFDTLKKYEIPFDEIYFGKPHAHFYIDDLSVKPHDMEREMGFYNADIDARHFNQIEYRGDHVIKHTNNPGEIYWYRNIPKYICNHFARAQIDGNVLTMERIEGIVFSYLLVNNSLTKQNLLRLLDTVNEIHTAEAVPDRAVDYNANYNAKLTKRYHAFDYSSISSDAGCYFEQILQHLLGHIPSLGVIHGDLVFSNIFLCDHQLIRFIDMRGLVDGVETIFGDIFYDYAKIYQSLLGYDFILNDREINEGYLAELREFFESYFVETFGADRLQDLKVITASLFFSLIPLHEDPEKQRHYFELMKRCL